MLGRDFCFHAGIGVSSSLPWSVTLQPTPNSSIAFQRVFLKSSLCDAFQAILKIHQLAYEASLYPPVSILQYFFSEDQFFFCPSAWRLVERPPQ